MRRRRGRTGSAAAAPARHPDSFSTVVSPLVPGSRVARRAARDCASRHVGLSRCAARWSGVSCRVEGLDLMLVEKPGLSLDSRFITPDWPASARRHLGKSGLAGAVDAQQADAVIDVQREVKFCDRIARRHSRRKALQPISGGASGRSGEGKLNGSDLLVHHRGIGSIFASLFMRDWACAALLALARKRSTKPCRCARSPPAWREWRLQASSASRRAGARNRRNSRRYRAPACRCRVQDVIDRVCSTARGRG